jgi:hypothetical protein
MSFFDALTNLRKVTINFIMSLSPCVRMEQLRFHCPDFLEFDILAFSENVPRNSSFIKIGQ